MIYCLNVSVTILLSALCASCIYSIMLYQLIDNGSWKALVYCYLHLAVYCAYRYPLIGISHHFIIVHYKKTTRFSVLFHSFDFLFRYGVYIRYVSTDISPVVNRRSAISSIIHMRYVQYIPRNMHTVFALLCFFCGYTLTDFPISIRLTSLAMWQSNDCSSASKATLMNMDKYFMRIHYERLHNHNKAKHSKTVCIFLGIYCRTLAARHKKRLVCSHSRIKLRFNSWDVFNTEVIHMIGTPERKQLYLSSSTVATHMTMIFQLSLNTVITSIAEMWTLRQWRVTEKKHVGCRIIPHRCYYTRSAWYIMHIVKLQTYFRIWQNTFQLAHSHSR